MVGTGPSLTHRIKLTEAQRRVVAAILPALAGRLRLDEPNERILAFTRDELALIHESARRAVRQADSGMKRNSLRFVVDVTARAIEDSQGFRAIPVAVRLYQFKVTLLNIEPPIWRRFQTRDCTLDRLHAHIQTAMGWTNSHLHHFKIDAQRYGDPMLLRDDFEERSFVDSTATKVSEIIPRSGKRYRFTYEYDFGDGWEHDVLFEGCLRAERGQRYPLCLEGARACPPEDVGGSPGYADFLQAIADPEDDERDQFVTWAGGKFAPEAFEPEKATKRMRRGLPDWRMMQWF
jgi:hypothetical protein